MVTFSILINLPSLAHELFDVIGPRLVGSPGLGLGSLNWDYFSYTWHTNRDTYDKLVFDDLKNHVVLAACLAYLASEDPEFITRERRAMAVEKGTGKLQEWPPVREPKREGGMNDMKDK